MPCRRLAQRRVALGAGQQSVSSIQGEAGPALVLESFWERPKGRLLVAARATRLAGDLVREVRLLYPFNEFIKQLLQFYLLWSWGYTPWPYN